MVTNRLGKKSVKKTFLKATAVIGTSTLLFMGLQAVSAAEQEKVPSEQHVKESQEKGSSSRRRSSF